MSVVNIAIKDRISSVPAGIILVCNNPTDTIQFEFDEEWSAHGQKVARFSWGNKYIDVPFTGNSVKVPEITNTQYVFVGVYANGIASTPIKLDCKRSILCLGDAEYVPPKHTYWDEFEATLAALNKAAEDTNQAALRAETATTAANTATSNAQSAADAANGSAELATVAAELANVAAQTIEEKAPAIVCTGEGEIITLSDSSDDPLRGLKVFGRTEQNGTPTPDAPVPLVSVGGKGSIGVKVTGKNLLPYPYDWLIHASESPFRDNGDGTVTIASEIVENDTEVVLIDDARALFQAGATYTVTDTHILFGGVRWVLAGETFTVTDADMNANQVSVRLRLNPGEAPVNKEYKPMIVHGAAAVEYEPYKDGGSLILSTPNGLPGIPVTSGGNYTDAAGQRWICDEIDMARGVYVQRVGNDILTGAQVEKISQTDHYFIATLHKANPYVGPVFCSHFANTLNKPPKNGEVYSIDSYYNYRNICFGKSDISSLVEARTWVDGNNVVVTYQLETPVETPLPAETIAAYRALHTHKPNTMITNDEGAHMAVDYNADTKTYIDNKFAALAAAMVNNA